jgi:hypothetical protein
MFFANRIFLNAKKLAATRKSLRGAERSGYDDCNIATLPQPSPHLLPFEGSRHGERASHLPVPLLRKICLQVFVRVGIEKKQVRLGFLVDLQLHANGR